jgi:hypothetical protein
MDWEPLWHGRAAESERSSAIPRIPTRARIISFIENNNHKEKLYFYDANTTYPRYGNGSFPSPAGIRNKGAFLKIIVTYIGNLKRAALTLPRTQTPLSQRLMQSCEIKPTNTLHLILPPALGPKLSDCRRRHLPYYVLRQRHHFHPPGPPVQGLCGHHHL